MKKLFILALALLLVGCTQDIDCGNVVVFVDGTITEKYTEHILQDERMHLEYHVVAEVGYPLDDEIDMKVSFYAFTHYEIGDTIQFALKG